MNFCFAAKRLCSLCCAVTLAAAAVSGAFASDKPAAEQAKGRGSGAAAGPAQPQPGTQGWPGKLQRAPVKGSPAGGAFGSRDWTPPPPPAPKAEPTLPPFPFQFVGRFEGEGQPITLYLTKGGRVYPVATGEVLDGTYRVESITAHHLEVTYLPLGRKQTLAFADLTPPPTPASSYPAPVSLLGGAQAAQPGGAADPPGTPTAASPQAPVTGTGGAAVRGGMTGSTAAPAVGASGTPGGTAPTPAATPGVMVIGPPTVKEMPILPPTANAMPILPPGEPLIPGPPGEPMPIAPAAGGIAAPPRN